MCAEDSERVAAVLTRLVIHPPPVSCPYLRTYASAQILPFRTVFVATMTECLPAGTSGLPALGRWLAVWRQLPPGYLPAADLGPALAVLVRADALAVRMAKAPVDVGVVEASRAALALVVEQAAAAAPRTVWPTLLGALPSRALPALFALPTTPATTARLVSCLGAVVGQTASDAAAAPAEVADAVAYLKDVLAPLTTTSPAPATVEAAAALLSGLVRVLEAALGAIAAAGRGHLPAGEAAVPVPAPAALQRCLAAATNAIAARRSAAGPEHAEGGPWLTVLDCLLRYQRYTRVLGLPASGMRPARARPRYMRRES